MNKKHKPNTTYFRFEMPVTSNGTFLGNLTIEGYGCLDGRKIIADIDSVCYENTEIKPVLEIFQGMVQIDAAAQNYVEDLFLETQLEIA
ncbi:MAG: hypothetical protein ABI237_05855 [Ginsengibacter sp.]